MLCPAVKRPHNPTRLAGHRIRIGTIQFGVAAELQDEADGRIWSMLHLMDGSRTVEEIVDRMVGEIPDLDGDSVREGIEALIENGFVEDAGAPRPSTLSEQEIARYRSNTNFFAWADTRPRSSPWECQDRLKKASVTVLGLGGTGSMVASHLVASGVGSLHCVDFDLVEEGNLTRQYVYAEGDVGRPKVERALMRLRAMNSLVEISGENRRIEGPEDVAELMAGTDFLILCADQPADIIQRWTNQAALATGTPWLMSLYTGPMLVVGTFVPRETPCYVCFAKDDDEQKKERGDLGVYLFDDIGPNPVIGPSAAATGSLGALEAIYFLTGMAPQTVGRILHQNLMVYDHIYYAQPARQEDCPACGRSVSVATERG